MPTPRRRAFTLIELLVVVAIITALIAILLPSLGKSKELAKRIKCSAQTRGIVQGMVMYANAENGFMPVTQEGPYTAPPRWQYAFDIRESLPNPSRKFGIGLLVDDGTIAAGSLPGLVHCPSHDTSGGSPWGTTGHGMDLLENTWWNGVGASRYLDPAFNGQRIVMSYNYRAPSYFYANQGTHLSFVRTTPSMIIMSDGIDQRFGVKYCHGDGYNVTSADGSGAYVLDSEFEVEQLGLSDAGSPVSDGRNNPVQDEQLFELLQFKR